MNPKWLMRPNVLNDLRWLLQRVWWLTYWEWKLVSRNAKLILYTCVSLTCSHQEPNIWFFGKSKNMPRAPSHIIHWRIHLPAKFLLLFSGPKYLLLSYTRTYMHWLDFRHFAKPSGKGILLRGNSVKRKTLKSIKIKAVRIQTEALWILSWLHWVKYKYY